MRTRNVLFIALPVVLFSSGAVTSSHFPGSTVMSSAPLEAGQAQTERPVVARVLQTGTDRDLGCCVLQTPGKPTCMSANRGFCRVKATEAHLGYDFHVQTACNALPQCR